MLALGVLGNPPANPYQPPLTNGIYLRWGFLREQGFPWHGFYLFRRLAQAGHPLCLSSITGGLKKGPWPDKKHYTAIGVLSSNLNLVLTDDFSPNGQVEFALSDRDYLRFDLPAGELARRIELRIGFPASGAAVSKVTVFSGAIPIRVFNVEGQAGQVASTLIEGDAISAVRIDSDTGALVDLCYVPVAQDATQGWDLLPGFSYPMGLPVHQDDYPCSVANPQALLTDRVHYQLPSAWDAGGPGTTFAELHDQLVKLVQGGPGAAPMADRIFAAPAGVSNPPAPDPPALNTFYILDMVLLGALHPALAQLVGLYWVDQTAVASQEYDYLIVADHTGVGERSADRVLSIIRTSGFAQLDGYIVFNKRIVAAPPLPAPVDLQSFALPGGAFPDVDGHLPPANNNAGLRWNVGWDDSDGLLPESAVMYLIWRANLGDEATPAPAGPYILITKDLPDKPKPIMVTEARIPHGLVTQRPPDWPAVPFFIDRNLGDGWYGYEVSGINLFGIYGPNSLPTLLRLQDKTPPPMTAAVEAYALDPDDPFLQKDTRYNSWRNGLDPGLVGLRVRWMWTAAHQRQAPDTNEFRIYFHLGKDLPLDQDQAINWQERYYFVAYDDDLYVTVDSVSGDRAYEIFLPRPTTPNPTSIPLNPTLADPVVYAHIGVSAADDKAHTADQRTSGNLSNRPGNEGSVGSPSKIYRVLRTLPAAPEGILNGERYYASPADYHDRSFFTYRWKPLPGLKLHVFRALDDGVFKADWAQRPAVTPLDESQLAFFPAGWNRETRRQVAEDLNRLDSFVPVADRTVEAMAYYRQLSDAALRVLAGLPNSENAFAQQTINPLDPNDTANANRLGPDDPDDLILDPSQRAFIDRLPGRATNRYFYRAASIDAAHNLGSLGLSSPPVYLPNVVPPRQPAWAGYELDDTSATLSWASNRETDLLEYQLFRTETELHARDLRLMQKIHVLTAPAEVPEQRPATVSWTDGNLIGASHYFYCLVAVDAAANVSTPSEVLTVVAVDTRIPDPPTWLEVTWVVLRESDGNKEPWPDDGVITSGMNPAVLLTWKSDVVNARFGLARRIRGGQSWKPIAGESDYLSSSASVYFFYDRDVAPTRNYSYRVRVTSPSGISSLEYHEVEVGRPRTG